MKKIVMFFLVLFCCSHVFAGPFDKIIFFGDSLTDNGNLYKLLLKVIPKSPPYYQGRFSNGPVWSEELSRYYYDKYYIDSEIYAVGGATAVFHLPNSRFISPTNLELEINRYSVEHLFDDKSKTLFSIWISANDYLYYHATDADELSDQIIAKIRWALVKLINQGGQYFLLLNLPDLSKTPFARENGIEATLHALSVLHNQKLAALIEELKATYPQVNFISFDIFNLLNDVMSNPAKYNEKYKINITNVNDSCWQGGYFFKAAAAKEDFTSKLKLSIIRQNGSIPKRWNLESVSRFIQQSPSLRHAYVVGNWYDEGTVPCANANEHIFWDQLHPTMIVHHILSQMISETVEQQIPA